MKPTNISISLYIIDGQPKAIIQLTLPNMVLEKDEYGLTSEAARQALRKAMNDAISEWEFNV